MSILKINNLHIKKKNQTIISDVSLALGANQFITIIGNRGAGKTVLMQTIFNLLPETMEVASGDVLYRGKSIFGIDIENEYRGRRIAPVFKDPRMVFNENYRVEKQIMNMLLSEKMFKNKGEIRKQIEMYAQQLDMDVALFKKYPKEIDNKSIKKIGLILAILFKPEILVIDDAFHRLDSISVKLIGLFLKELKQKMSILYLSSISSSLAKLSDGVYYIYKGKVLEQFTKQVKEHKHMHPYRLLFQNAIEPLDNLDETLTEETKGCIYYSMCSKRQNTCLTFDNSLKEYEEGHFLSCIGMEE